MREKLGKQLLPLVQLIPAAAVAALVLFTLPRTAPVLAAVPERLSASSETAQEETLSEETEEELLPILPYADGVYTGSSRGYGGAVKVQVTMAGGHITDLQILSAKHETSNFLRRAKRLLNIVMDAQTWEVDAVSEATYTSRGILGAIKNALTGEVVNNPLPPQPKPAAPLVEEVFETPSAYRDGVYTASAQGFGGLITVQVTVSGDAVTDISVVSHDGETTSYFSKARRVISTILETGSPEGVDAVSGATYSSTGILNAIKLALSKASGESTEEPVETPASVATEPVSESPAASEAPEEPSSDVMQPTWETVQPEQATADPFQWAHDLWDTMFPQESAASSVSSPEFFAEPASSSEAASETAPPDSTAAQPERPDDAEEQE